MPIHSKILSMISSCVMHSPAHHCILTQYLWRNLGLLIHKYLSCNNDGGVCSAIEAWDVTFRWEHYWVLEPLLMLLLGAVRDSVEPIFTVIPQIYFSLGRLSLIHVAYSLSFMNYHIMLICHDNLCFCISWTACTFQGLVKFKWLNQVVFRIAFSLGFSSPLICTSKD